MQGRARTKATKQLKMPNKLTKSLNLVRNLLNMTKENLPISIFQIAFLKIYLFKSIT
jgi:hypothetical protein